jgi:FMN phosphatase YigB (HAD superfamily)
MIPETGPKPSGWLVAIATNGTADNQLGKIQRMGLAEAADAYALSGIEGIRKPNPGRFEIATQRCGATLTRGGWMVGDHLIADINAARRLVCARSGSTETSARPRLPSGPRRS